MYSNAEMQRKLQKLAWTTVQKNEGSSNQDPVQAHHLCPQRLKCCHHRCRRRNVCHVCCHSPREDMVLSHGCSACLENDCTAFCASDCYRLPIQSGLLTPTYEVWWPLLSNQDFIREKWGFMAFSFSTSATSLFTGQ